MTTTTEIVLRAEHLLPGDVILTDAYDEHGMSTVYRDRVTSTCLFPKRVRINYETGTVSIPRETELRVERLECLVEFGPHDDHDDCQRMLDTMSASAYDLGMDYPEYDPQQDHYERFGRPAFPNEY